MRIPRALLNIGIGAVTTLVMMTVGSCAGVKLHAHLAPPPPPPSCEPVVVDCSSVWKLHAECTELLFSSERSFSALLSRCESLKP